MAQAIASTSKLVFLDEKGDPVRIWLDPSLPSFPDLAFLLRTNGASLVTSPAQAAILVLYPGSETIFDQYCHPAWLKEEQRLAQGGKGWEGKAILTERWPRLCIAAGRMMAASEDWGACRKGGPPKGHITPTIAAAAHSKPAPAEPAVRQSASPPINPLPGSPCNDSPAPHQASATAECPSASGPDAPLEAALPIPSTRFPLCPSVRVAQYSEDQLDEIFRNAHPMCLWQGMVPTVLGTRLNRTYPRLSASTWSKLYRKWLSGSDKFKPLATETAYLAYVDLFQPHLPVFKSFAESLTSIADTLERLHPDLGKSSTEWNILLGGWVRNMSPDVRAKTPPPFEAQSLNLPTNILRTGGDHPRTTAELREDAARRKVILAKEFKAKYDKIGLRTDLVGEDIASRYGYLQSSVKAWYCQWRTRDKRWQGIPEELQPTAMSASPTSTPAKSTPKRKAPPAEPGTTKRAKPNGGAASLDLATQGASTAVAVFPMPQASPPGQVLDPFIVSHSSGLARLPNTITHYKQSYTAQEYDEILRNAHPVYLLQGESLNEMGRRLAKSNPKMTNPTSWMGVYQKWLSGTRKFQPLLQQKGYLAHVELFKSYLPRIRQGATLRTVAFELASQHPENDSEMWNVHLGDWLRNMPFSEAALTHGPVPAISPPYSSSSSAPPPATAKEQSPLPPSISPRRPVSASKPTAHACLSPRKVPRPAPAVPPKDRDLSGCKVVIPDEGRFHVLAEMFKRDYDETTWSIAKVGREVAKRTGHKELTWEAWFGHWLHNDRRYAEVDDDFRPSRPRPSLAVGATSSSSTPSSASSPATPSTAKRAPKKPSQSRRPQFQFTNGKEAQMVEYIRSRQPMVTEAFEEDWADFADENPERSAAEYAEHHRLFRARINDSLLKLGGHVEGRRSSSFSSGKTGSSSNSGRASKPISSASTVVGNLPGSTGGKGKEKEVIDLTLSDDED